MQEKYHNTGIKYSGKVICFSNKTKSPQHLSLTCMFGGAVQSELKQNLTSMWPTLDGFGSTNSNRCSSELLLHTTQTLRTSHRAVAGHYYKPRTNINRMCYSTLHKCNMDILNTRSSYTLHNSYYSEWLLVFLSSWCSNISRKPLWLLPWGPIKGKVQSIRSQNIDYIIQK